MNNYVSPPELRQMEKLMTSFCYQNGRDSSTVFNDFLRYVISMFDSSFTPMDNWKYTKEETRKFYDIFVEWVKIMDKKVQGEGWYDAFGNLYMSLIVGKKHQQNCGQFFTPSCICEFMSQVTAPIEPEPGYDKINTVNDPTCGSGRLLLAHHSRRPQDYLIAEDIDYTCCLMTVCNFLIHGVNGEVVCRDSLNPSSYNFGWRVNELLSIIKVPNVRPMEMMESKAYISGLHLLEQRKEEEQLKKSETNISEVASCTKQLVLF